MIEIQPTWDINDPSKIKVYENCPRAYFYEYILGWRPTTVNIHLIFGEAWHQAQEHLLLNGYEDRHISDAFDKFLLTFRKSISEDMDEQFSPKTPFNALKALLLYAKEYKRDRDKYEVLYTEIAGTVSIADDTILHWRMDSILREIYGDKKYLSLDHKTSGRSVSTKWREQWSLDMQMGTYNHNLCCLYSPEEVKGIKVSGTFFLKTKIGFERVTVYRSKESMSMWLWNAIFYVDSIKRDIATLIEECSESDSVLMCFPMNDQNCSKYYGCAYHDFCCTWPNPLRKCEEPPLGFKIEHWNPMNRKASHKMKL